MTSFPNWMDVKVQKPDENTRGQTTVGVQLVAGRGLWIWAMRHLLTNTADVLFRHQWSIFQPAGTEEWPLTDHPALWVNYYEEGRYDFGGGWGNPGSELMMPLSPRHLLYAQVGKRRHRKLTLPARETSVIQRMLVERSHRLVFSTKPVDWIPLIRPRVVDKELYDHELDIWERWHSDQLQAETTQDGAS